jgi:predicted esterase
MRIIGFSQGGYLAPFIAHQLAQVHQVIGIGCEYLTEEFPKGISFRIDGIQAEDDEITPLETARKSHSNLKKLGIQGEFYTFPRAGHKIDDTISSKVKELIKIN